MTATDIANLAPVSGGTAASARLTKRQKAAVIVRFLLNHGAEVPLSDLPEAAQEMLTTQMGAMRYVDRDTLAEVLAEFVEEIEGTGLTFPRGVAGALSALDGQISPQTASRLRKEAGVRQFGDPWAQVCAAQPEVLRDILMSESTEVAAILLSKLDVPRAASLLGEIPGETARRITYAVSQTRGATPEAVDRIGLALAAELQDTPGAAFEAAPEERVGAILNFSRAAIRDEVLTGLEETDEDFASLVRRAIFTFENIPDRIKPLDVPTVTRDLDREELVTALAAALLAGGDLADAATFLLDNHSNRMRDTLHDEISERPEPSPETAEAAMNAVITNIRALEDAGEIKLILPKM